MGQRKVFIAIIVFIFALGVSSQQVFQQKKLQLKVGTIHKILLPDLTLSSFEINAENVSRRGSQYVYGFSVKIKNIGTAAVKKIYYLSFQKFDQVHNRWGGERDSLNCIKVTRLLEPNQSYTLNGNLRIRNFEISNKSLRVRAFVDSACNEEFPPTYFHIKELNENNNTSNIQEIMAGYYPHITSIKPNISRKMFDVVYIAGTGFGKNQGNHGIRIRQGNNMVSAPIKNNKWYDGVIYFTVPGSAKTGLNQVCIINISTMVSLSNEINLQVAETKVLTWDKLILAWDILFSDTEVHLHTWGSGAVHKNYSYLVIPFDPSHPIPIDIQRINWDPKWGHYRFFINDFNTKGKMTMSKARCRAHQLRLDVQFESAGREIKGYWRPLGGKKWSDSLAPDVHLDNGKLSVVLNLSANGDQLNYSSVTTLSARINAAGGWDRAMDWFVRNWNSKVANRINIGIREALNAPAVKTMVTTELTNAVRMLLGISKSRQITQIKFKTNGMHVTFY